MIAIRKRWAIVAVTCCGRNELLIHGGRVRVLASRRIDEVLDLTHLKKTVVVHIWSWKEDIIVIFVVRVY